MENIEDLWAKGNENVDEKQEFTESFIRESITKTSVGITAKLPKLIWFGLVTSIASIVMYMYNMRFYADNTPVLVIISILSVALVFVIAYLLKQLRTVKSIDKTDMDLKNILVYKIKYFTKQYRIVEHLVAISVVLATSTINLTMENDDGVISIKNVFILCSVYILDYIIMIFTIRLTNSVYLKQLRNALKNLEETTFTSIEKEIKHNRKIRIIIGVVAFVAFVAGVIVMLLRVRL